MKFGSGAMVATAYCRGEDRSRTSRYFFFVGLSAGGKVDEFGRDLVWHQNAMRRGFHCVAPQKFCEHSKISS